MQETALSLLPISHSVSMHHYSHWSSDQQFNIKEEVAALAKNHKADKDLVLVARAEGISLGLEAIKKGLISPEACMFVDVPKSLKSQVQALDIPILDAKDKLDVNVSKKFLSQLMPSS